MEPCQCPATRLGTSVAQVLEGLWQVQRQMPVGSQEGTQVVPDPALQVPAGQEVTLQWPLGPLWSTGDGSPLRPEKDDVSTT